VSLRDQSKAVAVTEELRGLVPTLSVVTVAQEADFANARNLPETIYECPPDFRPRPLPLSQPAVPPEARQFFGLLLFGFAGLVAAGNSTLMVLSRRTEFAILKAIGMRGFEIGLVVMVEVVTLAVIGLVLGFSVAEVGSLPIILTNRIGPAAVLKAIGRDFAIVASATLACAVVFALVPMSRTLRITVAEAMRGDE
jgi:ABC-type antimicrobial peptide transport system permease subunit